ncbi:hypothetical protein JVU11DRAFT_9935 [Chiua virens]|nr:hypothetical protein JVU11DRAFT_9935 [Chiua virens]
MVVTRRTPVVPPPPLARSHSSQGAQRPPRNAYGKDTASISNHSGPSVVAAPTADSSKASKDHRNGLDNSPGKKSKRSRRHNKNKYLKSNFQAFLDFLTKLLLVAFTIYMFSVCPQDTHLQSPICRGLAEYKRIVLDPYIIPPIQAMLAHPSVAPRIERAKPYVQRTVEIAAPILVRTRQQWNLHVVPQWEKHIVPEWNKRVVPQWNNLTWNPIANVPCKNTSNALRRVLKWQYTTFSGGSTKQEPYILLAMSKTKDGYNAAKPYAIPLARNFGSYTLMSPKIWEKVKELSKGEHVVREATSNHESSSSGPILTFVETAGYDTPISFTPSLSSTYHVTPIVEETVDEDVSLSLSLLETPPSTSAEPTLTPASGQVTVLSTPLNTPATAVGSPLSTKASSAPSLPESESPASSSSVLVEEFDAVSSSFLATATATSSWSAPSPADEPTEIHTSATPSKISIPAASATVPPANTPSDEEIDFDAFYAELGLGEPLKPADGSEGEIHSSPSQPAETEEERAEATSSARRRKPRASGLTWRPGKPSGRQNLKRR